MTDDGRDHQLVEEAAAAAIRDERGRLAREIHDGVAQHLAFLKMRVAWLRRSSGGVTDEQLMQIESVIERALTEARYAISTLRASPMGGSAAEAITQYAAELSEVSGLPISVQPPATDVEITPTAGVELFRIVQEALNNVRKHAQAKRVEIRMASRDSGLEIEIEDNGTGFTEGSDALGHFGLQIMEERANSVGGWLRVESAPREGTTVRVWVPGDHPHRSRERAG